MNIIDRVRTAADRRRRYNRLVTEIESLTERECTDIGITRYDAHRIARTSVYG